MMKCISIWRQMICKSKTVLSASGIFRFFTKKFKVGLTTWVLNMITLLQLDGSGQVDYGGMAQWVQRKKEKEKMAIKQRKFCQSSKNKNYVKFPFAKIRHYFFFFFYKSFYFFKIYLFFSWKNAFFYFVFFILFSLVNDLTSLF